MLQADLIFPPGSTTGWHIHPGPVVVVIKSGVLTEIQSNGCMVVHNAGTAFFESPDEVHNVVNQGSVVTEVFATFLSPTGAPPLIPVADPETSAVIEAPQLTVGAAEATPRGAHQPAPAARAERRLGLRQTSSILKVNSGTSPTWRQYTQVGASG